MSFPYSPRLQDVKMESLQTQLEHLNLLRLRHLQWMKSEPDPEIKVMHFEMVARIEAITNEYNNLLDALRR